MTAINFNNALGVHADFLEFRAARAEVLASNIANADTPGYKAQDLVVREVSGGSPSFSDSLHLALSQTHASHRQFNHGGNNIGLSSAEYGRSLTHTDHIAIHGNNDDGGGLFEKVYRTPTQQPGLDGNSVDVQRESIEFAQNALDFSVSFRLLNSRFSGLSKAIKGD